MAHDELTDDEYFDLVGDDDDDDLDGFTDIDEALARLSEDDPRERWFVSGNPKTQRELDDYQSNLLAGLDVWQREYGEALEAFALQEQRERKASEGR